MKNKELLLFSRRAATEGSLAFQGRVYAIDTTTASLRDAMTRVPFDPGRERPGYPHPSLRDAKD